MARLDLKMGFFGWFVNEWMGMDGTGWAFAGRAAGRGCGVRYYRDPGRFSTICMVQVMAVQ